MREFPLFLASPPCVETSHRHHRIRNETVTAGPSKRLHSPTHICTRYHQANWLNSVLVRSEYGVETAASCHNRFSSSGCALRHCLRWSNQWHTNANILHSAAAAGLCKALASVQRHRQRRRFAAGLSQAHRHRLFHQLTQPSGGPSPRRWLPPPAPLFYFNLPSPPRHRTGTIHPPRTRSSRVSLHR